MPPRTRTSLRQDAERFYDALQNLIRSYQFRSISGPCRHDLSVTECYCLEVIVREGPLTLSTLARGIRLDKSTLSRTISNLESKRYVAREVLDCDARSSRIRATASGRQLYRRIRGEVVRGHEEILADLNAATRTAVIGVLVKLAG